VRTALRSHPAHGAAAEQQFVVEPELLRLSFEQLVVAEIEQLDAVVELVQQRELVEQWELVEQRELAQQWKLAQQRPFAAVEQQLDAKQLDELHAFELEQPTIELEQRTLQLEQQFAKLQQLEFQQCSVARKTGRHRWHQQCVCLCQ